MRDWWGCRALLNVQLHLRVCTKPVRRILWVHTRPELRPGLRFHPARLSLISPRLDNKVVTRLLLFLVSMAALQNDALGQYVVAGGPVLRSFAISAKPPPYPRSSFSDHHEGRAVVRIRVSVKGQVALVEVLESPDKAISAAVKATIFQWSFRPMVLQGRKDALPVESRFVFYFRIVDGKPVVIDAQDTAASQSPRKE